MNTDQKPHQADTAEAEETAKKQASAKPPQQHGFVKDNATYQDVIDAPEHKVAEIVDGRLYISPRPSPLPGFVKTYLGAGIGIAFSESFADRPGGLGGWWILKEPEIHFDTPSGKDVVVPDIVGWRTERLPEFPDVAYMTLAPDWACEFLTPPTRELDIGYKREIYAREGVPHLWFVDAAARTLEAFELRNSQWVLTSTLKDGDRLTAPPFEALPPLYFADLSPWDKPPTPAY